MTLYGQTFTVSDPGLGTTEPAPTTVLVMGTSSTGTVNTLYTCANKPAAITAFGQGPLPECICHIMDMAGGPVLGMRITGSVAGACGAWTAHAVGAGTGTITTGGEVPFDAYQFIVEITTTGTLGTGGFMYSCDNGANYSEELVIPAGGTFAVPNTNVTLTFVPGGGPTFFQDGDWHEMSCTSPHYAAADLATAITAVRALPATTEWAFIVLPGRITTAAAAALIYGGAETHAASLTSDFRFCRWMMDAGIDTPANVNTSFDAVDNSRILVSYGTAVTASSKPFVGWGNPSLPIVNNIAGRAAASLLSTDLGRVASGSLDGVTAISHDEYTQQSLDTHKIATLRSWFGRPGFYITRGRIHCAPGSDFQDWQLGRIIDVACRRTYLDQQMFIGIGVRTNSDGTIDERDALRLETRVNESLRSDLTQPDNAEGTRGHVSSVSYAVDRTNNVLTTSTLQSEVGVRPLGYARWITTSVGFDIAAGE